MENHIKNLSLSRIIKNLAQTSFHLVQDIFILIGLEARLAAISFVIILALSLAAIAFITIIWLNLCALILLGLLALHLSLLLSLVILFAFNLLALVLLALGIMKAKNNLSFPVTRGQLKGIGK